MFLITYTLDMSVRDKIIGGMSQFVLKFDLWIDGNVHVYLNNLFQNRDQ